jgi:Ran GTPase-activating protein (RanGAP) involved in mRNA processing and transport
MKCCVCVPREFVPIIGALAYNRWFTGFSYQGNKLTAEGFDTLARALQLSISLEKLKLKNSGLNKDTILKLAKAIETNSEAALKILDLSGNALDDRGVIPLSNAVVTLPNGLEQLRLSRVGLTSRGVGPLAQALKKNTHMTGSLKVLALSDNHLRPEGLQVFVRSS